tara:strand:- start:5069 stop:5629 length:561 start_codon:yes stop_codon:yes gene_type:complete
MSNEKTLKTNPMFKECNVILAPPRIGTLNEQLKYWNGQKVHIENHQNKLLMNIAKLMAEYEFHMYSKISKPKKSNNLFYEINTYFNKSSTNAALGALLFQNYYAQTLMTKGQLTWHLGISRNALSEKVDTCVKNNYLVKFNTKYGASDHLIDAYLDYANQSADGMKELANNITSLINVYTAEKNTK